MARKSRTSSKKLAKERRRNEKRQKQIQIEEQEEKEVIQRLFPPKPFFDRLILLLQKKGYQVTHEIKDKLYKSYVVAYQNGLSPLEIYQLLLESFPHFGDISDPKFGALYESDVKGGLFPSVPGYSRIVINGGSKKNNTKKKKCSKRKRRTKRR